MMKNLMWIRMFLSCTALLLLSGCGNGSASSASLICPSKGPIPANAFCVTRDEQKLGQQPAVFRTIPASFFISAGVELTTDPHDHPLISKSQIEKFIESKMHISPREVVLVHWHGIHGPQTAGQLTWVVNETSPGFHGVSGVGGPSVVIPSGTASITVPNPRSSGQPSGPYYEVVTFNANTGAVTGSMSS